MSNLKPYGWGIVDKDGRPIRTFREEEAAIGRGLVKYDNGMNVAGAPFKFVQLFYKEGE